MYIRACSETNLPLFTPEPFHYIKMSFYLEYKFTHTEYLLLYCISASPYQNLYCKYEWLPSPGKRMRGSVMSVTMCRAHSEWASWKWWLKFCLTELHGLRWYVGLTGAICFLLIAVIALFCRQYDIIKDNDNSNSKEKVKPSSERSTPEHHSGGLLRSKVQHQ